MSRKGQCRDEKSAGALSPPLCSLSSVWAKGWGMGSWEDMVCSVRRLFHVPQCHPSGCAVWAESGLDIREASGMTGARGPGSVSGSFPIGILESTFVPVREAAASQRIKSVREGDNPQFTSNLKMLIAAHLL